MGGAAAARCAWGRPRGSPLNGAAHPQTPCNEGQYKNGSSCSTCPSSTGSPAGSTDLANCTHLYCRPDPLPPPLAAPRATVGGNKDGSAHHCAASVERTLRSWNRRHAADSVFPKIGCFLWHVAAARPPLPALGLVSLVSNIRFVCLSNPSLAPLTRFFAISWYSYLLKRVSGL